MGVFPPTQFGPQFGLKTKGAGPQGPSAGSATVINSVINSVKILSLYQILQIRFKTVTNVITYNFATFQCILTGFQLKIFFLTAERVCVYF